MIPGVVEVLGVFGVPGTSTSKFSDQARVINGLGRLDAFALLLPLLYCWSPLPMATAGSASASMTTFTLVLYNPLECEKCPIFCAFLWMIELTTPDVGHGTAVTGRRLGSARLYRAFGFPAGPAGLSSFHAHSLHHRTASRKFRIRRIAGAFDMAIPEGIISRESS